MAAKCEDTIIPPFTTNVTDLCLGLNLKTLKPLDEVLRCRICDDYFNNCMMTKCSHNYCSVCIRRYMMYKAQCPTCFQDASEPELRNNRLIDEIIRTYKKIRVIVDSDVSSNSAQAEYQKLDSSVDIEIKKEQETKATWKEKNQDSKEIVNTVAKEVPCPVCYMLVTESRINIHLDTCLKMKEKENDEERKSLPKLVYHLLSDKDIRKKLKEHGLKSTGNRQALIRRHKNFIVLFNANCDSLNPKTVADIVTEIERQELEEHLNSLPKEIQVNKKSDICDIEREHESYVKRHQSQFNNLIHDVQQRHIDRIGVKQEMRDDSPKASGSLQSAIDNLPNVFGETSVKVENDTTSDEIKSTQLQDNSTCQKDSREEKVTPSEKSKEELCTIECIKKEPISPTKITEESLFSKSIEKMQDPFTNDSPPEEFGKIVNLSLLHKRKRGKVSLENQYSPKKK